MRFNLNPKQFSTKSFKNCGISTLQRKRDVLGKSEKEIANQFDHAAVNLN